MRVLIVNGFDSGDDTLADELEHYLAGAGHQCVRTNLEADGFGRFMSAAERVAYHSERPLITPETQTAARQLLETQAIVILYPQRHRGFPARVKSWNERVFVPGVGFRFKPSGVVTGALDHLKQALIVEVAATSQSRLGELWGRVANHIHNRSLPGPTLARSFRLTSNRKCRAKFRVTDGTDSTTLFRQLDRWR